MIERPERDSSWNESGLERLRKASANLNAERSPTQKFVLSTYDATVKMFLDLMDKKEQEGFIISKEIMSEIFDETRIKLMDIKYL